MKKLALFSFLLFLFPACSSAQIYHAGGGSQQNKPAPVFPWEMSVGVTGVFSPVEEPFGERLLNFQWGLSACILYYLTPWVAVGPEGTVFFPASASPIVDKYRVRRAGVVGKFLWVEDSSTRSYSLLAAGFTRREVAYSFNWSESADSSYIAFGTGVETDIAEAAFIGVELRGIYNTKTELGMFSRMVSRWEAEVSVRAGVRF